MMASIEFGMEPHLPLVKYDDESNNSQTFWTPLGKTLLIDTWNRRSNKIANISDM